MNSPSDQIAREIAANGPMTCARFMELALFAPGAGYYERQPEIGRSGDFYTSVSVGPVFGELLAFQFAQWADALPGEFALVEAGSHRGLLAADILRWLREFRPDLLARMEYRLVEPSPIHEAWQRETLREWADKTRWLASLSQMPPRGVDGVIFSNELLDAMPAHRLAWSRAEKTWREWFVRVEGGRLVWQPGHISPQAARRAPRIPDALAEALPDQFALEISPAAVEWWAAACRKLRRGKILTLDYGMTDDEWPAHAAGTLRAYGRHHADADVLADPGSKDLTAHVQFTAIQRAGEEAGLRTEDFCRQSAFLTRIFAKTQTGGFAAWTPERARQFQTLTHPEHLGHAFRALVQSTIATSGR